MFPGYVFALLITRNLGARAFGIFALAVTILNLFSIAGRVGFDTALLRFVAEYSSAGRRDLVDRIYARIMRVVTPLCLLLSVVLYFSSPFLARLVFHKEYLAFSFRIMSFAVLPSVLVLIDSQALRGLKKIKAFSFFQNIAISLSAALFLGGLLIFDKGENLPVIAQVLALFASALAARAVWRRYSRFRQEHTTGVTNRGAAPEAVIPGHFVLPVGEDPSVRKLLGVSLPMLLSSSMFFTMQWSATIILGIFRSDAEVGIFNIAVKIAAVTGFSLIAINSIAAPKFAEAYGKKDIAALRETARLSTKLIFWTSFPLLVVLLAFPRPILGLFGHEFRAGYLALIFLVAGQFVNAITGPVGALLQMTGRERVFHHIMLISTVINVILNVLLTPGYGISGAALANAVSMIFCNLCCAYFAKAELDVVTLYIPKISFSWWG